MQLFSNFARGLFGTTPAGVHTGGKAVAHPIFAGVSRIFVGHHNNPRVPIAPVKHPPLNVQKPR